MSKRKRPTSFNDDPWRRSALPAAFPPQQYLLSRSNQSRPPVAGYDRVGVSPPAYRSYRPNDLAAPTSRWDRQRDRAVAVDPYDFPERLDSYIPPACLQESSPFRREMFSKHGPTVPPPSEPIVRLSEQHDRGSPSKDAPNGEEAVIAWSRRFGIQRQLELKRDEKEPFNAGRRLGGGGVGIVHETFIDGIPLALKRTHARRPTSHELNEMKILGQISKKRHRHIVELVGSYTHRQRGGYELGLLIWPVAQTDFATLLRDLGALDECISSRPPGNVRDAELVPQAAMEPLDFLKPTARVLFHDGLIQRHYLSRVNDLVRKCRSRIWRSMGCIVEAVTYLHAQNIRHKSLKPSQVLLTYSGLWLTDFGWSRDTSDLTHSATSGGDNTTTKYHAPERARREPCGRSEDVFGLGCMFLEMSYAALVTVSVRVLRMVEFCATPTT